MEILNTIVAGVFSIVGTIIGVWLNYYLQNKRARPPATEHQKAPEQPKPTETSETLTFEPSEPAMAESPTPKKAPTKKKGQSLEKASKWWIGLSVFMVVEIIVMSIVDADTLGALNILWLIPLLTIIFSIFAPVQWNLAVFYVLLFQIATVFGYKLGGQRLDFDDILQMAGIIVINAAICVAIVLWRERKKKAPK